MVLTMKLIRPVTFDIEDAPVYGKVCLTRSSGDVISLPAATFDSPPPRTILNSPDAFVFARDDGGFLQSVGHAVVARVAFHKDAEDVAKKLALDGSQFCPEYRKNAAKALALNFTHLYQKTSTVGIKYQDKTGWKAAFMELPDEDASYELVKEGYNENCAKRELIKPCTDSLVARLLEQARDEKRVCDVLTNNPLKLGTSGQRSAYGTHPYVIALFGNQEIAQLNAQHLHDDREIDEGCVWDFTASDLEKIMKDGQALIRPVGLGADDSIYIKVLPPDYDGFLIDGIARGVVNVGQNSNSK